MTDTIPDYLTPEQRTTYERHLLSWAHGYETATTRLRPVIDRLEHTADRLYYAAFGKEDARRQALTQTTEEKFWGAAFHLLRTTPEPEWGVAVSALNELAFERGVDGDAAADLVDDAMRAARAARESDGAFAVEQRDDMREETQ